jgi:alpha-glucosidase
VSRPAASGDEGTARDPEWWRNALVYQVYIRSFADSDGDGLGDIDGIRNRLPYLADLGVDAIWVTPWYPSPMADGGYDVADYRAIDPRFGTLDDARALIAEAHETGLRVLLDIVPNHTSVEHRWFREALAAGRGSAARSRYLFRDGRGRDGGEPPNDWQSVFGGPAWTPAPVDGVSPRQWYLHLFDSSQPDLDWDEAEVRAEFESVLEHWLDLGADGFRIDVACFLLKDRALPDVIDVPGTGEAAVDAAHPFQDREGVHEIYRAWRRIADRHGAVFCGEIDLPADRIARYLRPDEVHTAFNFDFIRARWTAADLRASIDRTMASHRAVSAPATWVLGNHDLPRPPYRLGLDASAAEWNPWWHGAPSDQALGLRRARAAALLQLALPGSAYVYQGEELGLPEVLDLPADVRQDPTFARTGGVDIGRDGCRVPIPWSGSEPPYGFGPPGSRPWLPQPASWAALSIEAESRDPGSTLSFYRAAIRLRREDAGFAGMDLRWLDGPDGTLWFERGNGLECCVNLSAGPVTLPRDRATLLASGPGSGDPLPPDAAEWFRRRAAG